MVAQINNSPYNIGVFRDFASALKWLDRAELDIENVFKALRGDTAVKSL